MRSLLAAITVAIGTIVGATIILVAKLLRRPVSPGSIYEQTMRGWARSIVRAAGVKIVVHGEENLPPGGAVCICNHVSWFDVLTLAAVLPRYKFVGKAELFRIPLFGRAARAAGMIPIERENRKSAFESYRVAAERIRAGASVVVFPEGTRGKTYALRTFKKGPFVLAVAAGVPIVPVIVHGTIEVMPRDTFRVRSRVVDIHFLEPIDASGLTYEDRNRLSRAAWDRMAAAMRELYGVDSGSTEPAREDAAAD